MPAICPEPVYATTAATVTVVGEAPRFSGQFATTSGEQLFAANGDLDLSNLRKPVAVTLTITDPDRVFYQHGPVTVLEFSDLKNGHKQPIPTYHHQFRNTVQLSTDRRTVTFCYKNDDNGGDRRRRHAFRQSSYGLKIGQERPYVLTGGIDPTVSNGGND